MLNQLLALFAGRHRGLSIEEISRELGAQPGAVAGMLDLLVSRGRLLEIGPDGGCCAACGLESQCSLLAARGKRYVLAPAAAPCLSGIAAQSAQQC
jgi:hypothetical protein